MDSISLHAPPDGRRLACASDEPGATGIHLRPLPGFGDHLAFYSEVGGNSDIYVLGLKSRETKRLTTHPATDENPRWSRDGKWIYFSSQWSRRLAIWRIRVEGGTPVPMEGALSNATGTPIESRDGRYFYFLRESSVWRAPVGGGEADRVVDEVRPEGGIAVFDDGIYYVGEADESGRHPIQFKDFATGRVETLARSTETVYWNVAVSPDRRTLLYVQTDDEGSDLMLVENFR